MIGRSDGGSAGGVLPLTDEMQQHGARPTWLGYIAVDDVDAAVARDRAGRRQGADAGVRHPRCRPHRDGRRPAGRAVLRDEADPAGRATRTRPATSSRPTSRSACRWNELADHATRSGAIDFYRRPVRLEPGRRHGYGRDGQIPLHPAPRRTNIGAVMPQAAAAAGQHLDAITSASTTSTALPRRSKPAAASHQRPDGIPGGDFASQCGSTRRARDSALVGPRK